MFFSNLTSNLYDSFLPSKMRMLYECPGSSKWTLHDKSVVGNGGNGVKLNVPALEASIAGGPRGLVQSKNGDLYCSLFVQNLVLKAEFDSVTETWSNVTVIAGTNTQGKGDDHIPGVSSALNRPWGLSLIESSSGSLIALLIADSNNNRIRRLDMSTGIITTIAGGGTSIDDGVAATDAALQGPQQAYYDKHSGDIFIVELTNKKIRRVYASNNTITTIAGKCTNNVNNGDGGAAISACLLSPSYIAMNEIGELFVLEENAKIIRRVDLKGNIETVAGLGSKNGDGTVKDVKLNLPHSIALTQSGELLVDDGPRGIGYIEKRDHDGFWHTIAGGGSVTSDNVLATTASILPFGVAQANDGSEDIFICETTFIRKLTLVKCYGEKSNKASVCSGHGSCVAPDQCECDEGWMGVDCSITHCFGFTSNIFDQVCSGRGTCVRPNKCHCDEGFRGNRCQHQVN